MAEVVRRAAAPVALVVVPGEPVVAARPTAPRAVAVIAPPAPDVRRVAVVDRPVVGRAVPRRAAPVVLVGEIPGPRSASGVSVARRARRARPVTVPAARQVAAAVAGRRGDRTVAVALVAATMTVVVSAPARDVTEPMVLAVLAVMPGTDRVRPVAVAVRTQVRVAEHAVVRAMPGAVLERAPAVPVRVVPVAAASDATGATVIVPMANVVRGVMPVMGAIVGAVRPRTGRVGEAIDSRRAVSRSR